MSLTAEETLSYLFEPSRQESVNTVELLDLARESNDFKKSRVHDYIYENTCSKNEADNVVEVFVSMLSFVNDFVGDNKVISRESFVKRFDNSIRKSLVTKMMVELKIIRSEENKTTNLNDCPVDLRRKIPKRLTHDDADSPPPTRTVLWRPYENGSSSNRYIVIPKRTASTASPDAHPSTSTDTPTTSINVLPTNPIESHASHTNDDHLFKKPAVPEPIFKVPELPLKYRMKR